MEVDQDVEAVVSRHLADSREVVQVLVVVLVRSPDNRFEL